MGGGGYKTGGDIDVTDVRNLCLSLSRTGAGVFGTNDVDKQVVQHKLPVHMYVVCGVYGNIFLFSAPRQR